jgi:hypothetical protein
LCHSLQRSEQCQQLKKVTIQNSKKATGFEFLVLTLSVIQGFFAEVCDATGVD